LYGTSQDFASAVFVGAEFSVPVEPDSDNPGGAITDDPNVSVAVGTAVGLSYRKTTTASGAQVVNLVKNCIETIEYETW